MWRFNIKFLNKWRELFPAAKVHEVCNAGHLVVEDASDEIIPWIEEFLRKTLFIFKNLIIFNIVHYIDIMPTGVM